MADTKISAATDAGTLLATDMLPLARASDTSAYHATMAEVATFVSTVAPSVASFNTRTGAVTLSSADVTAALTYTPYNSTNPAGYQTAAQVAAAAGAYLPLVGGTLTGPLTVTSATDANIYVTGTGAGWPGVKWNTTQASGTAAGLFESHRQGKTRWSVEFGGTEAESGGNAGTNFRINRFDDAGSVLSPTPLTINRASGLTTLSSATVTGTTTLSGAATVNGSLTGTTATFTATQTQPTTDYIYSTFSSEVVYTANGTGGDSLGLVSYMAVRANGHTVPNTASQHTAAIYGNGYLESDGNAASNVDTINGGMFVTGNGGPGTVVNAVDIRGHSNYNTGGGAITNHYFLFHEPSTAAAHHYGAYFSAPIGIGTTTPTYNLQVFPTGGGNILFTNWMQIGTGITGQFTVAGNGASFYPGYNPGAGGLGVLDLVVGNNGTQNPTNATGGFLYISSCAGPPTGGPSQAAIGRIPITIDTAANRLWAYVNGAWNGIGLSTGGGPTARNAARMQIAWDTPALVVNDTVYFVYDAPYAGTINSMTYFTANGSFTANVQIAGSSVTGLAAVAVSSSTPATATATAANTFTAGQRIGVVITSATGSPTDALLSLNVTWS